jgi:hypothetical protein
MVELLSNAIMLIAFIFMALLVVAFVMGFEMLYTWLKKKLGG